MSWSSEFRAADGRGQRTPLSTGEVELLVVECGTYGTQCTRTRATNPRTRFSPILPLVQLPNPGTCL